MKLDDLKLDHLKEIAREHKLKGFSTMKKPDILKHVRKHLGSRVKVVNGRPTMEGKGKKERCWDGYEPAEGRKPFSKGSCKKSEGGSVIATAKGEGNGEVSDRLRKLVDRLKGGNIQVAEGKENVTNTKGGAIAGKMTESEIANKHPPGTSKAHIKAMKKNMDAGMSFKAAHDKADEDGFPPNIGGGAIRMPMRGGDVKSDEDDDDPIDWDDIKWGSFTEQLKQYNKRHKNKFTGDKALCDFADMTLSNKSKYSTTTKRRASFYLNVLAKKKCG